MFNRRKLLASGIASAAIIQFPGITRISHAQTAGIPSVTFTVDEVKRGNKALKPQPINRAIQTIIGAPDKSLESWSRDVSHVVAAYSAIHPFLSALNTAFHQHYPIILSPDMIWLQILQGLASHVNANAEALRQHFVAHEGKKLIEIRRNGFVKGNPGNDWEGAFAEFSSQMRSHIGDETHDLIASGFGTTGPAEQAAMNVALMDAMQSYFAYSATTACGFPEITLEGSEDDWRALRLRAARLETYDLKWWTKHLLPVLDQFVGAAAGKPDKDFWCNFYKLKAPGSGAVRIHGHVNVLFPYFGRKSPTKERLVNDFEVYVRNTNYMGRLTEEQVLERIKRFTDRLQEDTGALKDTLRRNPYLGRMDMTHREGMTTGDIKTKLNSAPMIWNYYDTMYQMQLLAGFIGSTQDPTTLAIRPKIGWAIREGVS